MGKAGRKRKSGKREPNGRHQRPADYANLTAQDNMCVVIDARQRHLHITPEQAKDPDYGHTLGCLRLNNVISKPQMLAGNRYMEDFFRYTRLKGFPPRTAKAASLEQMIVGQASGHIPDDDTVKRAEDRLKAAQAAVVEVLGITQSIPAFNELERFAINQEHWGQCTPARSGPLRECLNVLARHYGV